MAAAVAAGAPAFSLTSGTHAQGLRAACRVAAPAEGACKEHSASRTLLSAKAFYPSFSGKDIGAPRKGRSWSIICSSGRGNGGAKDGLPAPEDDDMESFQREQSLFHPAFSSSTPRDMDWRTFRAQLVDMEQQAESRAGESRGFEDNEYGKSRFDFGAWTVSSRGREGREWAHVVPKLERGCILVATEQLNGYAFFEKSVILMLSHEDEEAPYGVVLNKPLSHRIGTMKGMSHSLMKTFGSCPVNVGGPLDTRRFILLHNVGNVNGSDEVLPGTYCGSMSSMEAAVSAVNTHEARPEDFRFFFGYAGWDSMQLQKEVRSGWWQIAACSPGILLKTPHDKLWEEVLQLMGGEYVKYPRTDV